MIDIQFDVLEKTRIKILDSIKDLTIDQINTIPDKFNNNIAWNFAHLIVTQQLLCYKFSGLDCHIDEKSINMYRKGTAPNSKMTLEEFQKYKELFLLNVERIKDDYNKGRFKTYNTYTTSANVTLASIEDAIAFNNMHEGIHLGSILALKKVI